MNDYHFITTWRVKATPRQVYEIIEDAASLPRWWPSVYLDVQELEPDAEGNCRYVLHTKGWLPYTLRWGFRTVHKVPAWSIELEVWGDFEGRGLWTFMADGEYTEVTYDWQVSASKPLLRNLGFALRPVFEANHRWAMAMGEESLKLELERRAAPNAAARAAVPDPPGPTSDNPVPLAVGVVGAGLGIAGAIWGIRRIWKGARKAETSEETGEEESGENREES